MEYSDIKKIEVFTNPSVVNEYLSLGWRLLNIYTTAQDTHQTANYVLGWPISFEHLDPVYPKTKSE